MKNKIEKEDAVYILDRIIEFIRNCDNKASIFLGIAGAVLTVIITNDGISNLKSILNAAMMNLTYYSIVYILIMLLSTIMILFGISQVIKVLSVQTDFSKEKGLDTQSKIFFGHIAKNKSYVSYRKKLYNITKENFENDIISQIYINACICNEKYKKYDLGMKSTLVGFFIFIIFWAVGIIVF